MILHVGFDDTDSPKGGCTTYIGTILVERLQRLGVKFIDFPHLIRLNPNIPFKTRGNAAACLRLKIRDKQEERIKEIVSTAIREFSELEDPNTNPGVVFLKDNIPEDVKSFSKRVIQDIITLSEAHRVIERNSIEYLGFGNKRGLIGGLAAVGATFDEDFTYELLAYRKLENCGKKREVNPKSVFEMAKKTSPFTFSNFDPENKRILITPHGPDPVLFGIRGETPEMVKKAFKMVISEEPIDRWMIYKTNQGTDAHLEKIFFIKDIRPYQPAIIRGEVCDEPKIIRGGHVFFRIADKTGSIDCAAYEPTGGFRNIVKKLIKGDIVEVYGGVRPPSSGLPMTLNLEKLKILSLQEKFKFKNPICPLCRKRMKSEGKNKGFECKKCKIRGKFEKMKEHSPRDLKCGLYIPPPRAHRHLTKPFSRIGLEKKGDREFGLNTFSSSWHWP